MSELPTSNIEACISRCTCMDDHSKDSANELRVLIEDNHRLRVVVLELQDTIDGDGFVIDNQRAIIDRLRIRIDEPVDEVEELDGIQYLVSGVVSAITDKGPMPKYHDKIVAKQRKMHPTLWRALDELIKYKETTNE